MTKKNFRANWEQVFVGYNDAELYAKSVWIYPADGQSVH